MSRPLPLPHGLQDWLEQLDAQLLQRHDQLQREVTQAYSELSRSVGAALQENVTAGAQAAGTSLARLAREFAGLFVRSSR